MCGMVLVWTVAVAVLDRLRLVLLPVPLAHLRVADFGQALESLTALRRGSGVVLRGRARRGGGRRVDVVGAPHQHRLARHLLNAGGDRREVLVCEGVRFDFLHLGGEQPRVDRRRRVIRRDPVDGRMLGDLARLAQLHHLHRLDDPRGGTDGVGPADVETLAGVGDDVAAGGVHVGGVFGGRVHHLLARVELLVDGHAVGGVVTSCGGGGVVGGEAVAHVRTRGRRVVVLGVVGAQGSVLVEQILRRGQVSVVEGRGGGVQPVLEVRMAHVGEAVVRRGRGVRRAVHVVRGAAVRRDIIHRGHRTDDRRRHRRVRRGRHLTARGTVRQFALGPTGRQEVSQLGFVPPVHPRRSHRDVVLSDIRSTAQDLIAFREVAVWKPRVQVTHFEVHGALAEKIPSFFLPANHKSTQIPQPSKTHMRGRCVLITKSGFEFL
jgi:hypothetical protein